MKSISFRITSYEPDGAYSTRTITLSNLVSCGERNDYLWAEVDPPFEPPIFGIETNLSLVLLAPRFAGDVISESANWPLHVYVCRTKTKPVGSDVVPPEDVEILNWGLLEPL